ncbi:MAG: clan AA aspartic protease [Bacteroidota bacterium]
MIDGFVEPSLDAVVTLNVRGPEGSETIDVVVDTGFSGWISLPSHLVRRLGLPWMRSGRAALADGTEVKMEVYDGEVEWHDGWRAVAIDEADTDPLVGMSLLRQSRLVIEVTEGGHIRIEPLGNES